MKLVRKTLLALIVVLASVKFGPSGTVFNTEVEVTLKLPVKPDSNNLAVFYHNEEDIWEYVTDASLDDDKATFKITHFSEYIIKDDITSETLDKSEYFVEQANLSGQSDKWILDSFVDYLINEAHVMDYVKRFGNYYYSAENILVAGLYHYNDKEGDPNDLIWYSGDRIYGISSQSTDRNTAVNAGNNYVENTLLTDITIVLEYVMITPSIEGIISEKVNFDLFPVPPEYFRVSPQICGDVKVDLKYNFTGYLKENAGQVSGKIFISDITAKIDSTSKPVSYYYTPTEELDYECEYEVFSSADFNYNEMEIDVNGSVDEFKGETKQFIKVMYDSN